MDHNDHVSPLVGWKKYVSILAGTVSYVIMTLTLVHSALFLFKTEALSGESSLAENFGNLFSNVGLILLFFLQHSYMASDMIKNSWKGSNMAHLQRATYVLATAVCLEFMITMWTPSRTLVWKIGSSWKMIIQCLYCFGWAFMVGETFLMDHMELSGLKQIWFKVAGQPEDPLDHKPLGARRLYSHLRHPILISFLLVLWMTPVMTLDRFLLAASLTLYLWMDNSVDAEDVAYVDEKLKEGYQLVQSFM